VSELADLVDIPTCVCSSLAGSACRNLCLSYLVLWIFLPVSVAVWLAVSVESVSGLSVLMAIPECVCSSLAGTARRNLGLRYLVCVYPYLCL
jgi:hypothetical protein